MRNKLFVPISPGLLQKIGVREDRAKRFSQPITQTMGQYKVWGPDEQAHFLGQILVESAMLRYTKEVWGPSRAQKRYDIRTDLGNTPERDGDGRKYSGRGIIQVTGRDNYERFQRHLKNHHGLNYNLVEDPSPVADAPLNCMCAGWYWASHNLSDIASKGVKRRYVTLITEAINGGHNHLKERYELTQTAYPHLLDALEEKREAEKVAGEEEPVSVFSKESVGWEIEEPYLPHPFFDEGPPK